MSDTFRLKVYFPPQGELATLERERERTLANAKRNAAHYAALVREIDERIARLRNTQEVNDAR